MHIILFSRRLFVGASVSESFMVVSCGEMLKAVKTTVALFIRRPSFIDHLSAFEIFLPSAEDAANFNQKGPATRW